MIRRFKPRMEILPSAQQSLWPELRPVREMGFVLYGGTAVALRLGHRASIDFDLFTSNPLDSGTLRATCPCIGKATVLQDRPDTLTVLIPGGKSAERNVKVSFFGGIHIGRVGEPEFTEDEVLQVASLDDLMATKIKVMLQRVEAKDYKDIAAMLAAGVSLAAAREMYGRDFQPSESLKTMVYFEGGDLHILTPEEKERLIIAAGAVRDLPRVRIVSRELALSS